MSGYKRYPAYKESGVEWIGEIPAEWEFQRIKWSCSYRVSNVDKVASTDEEPVRLCNYTDVYYNDFINPSMDFMEATATTEEIERFGLMPDDVLITKDSESWDDIGVPALVTDSEPDLVCGYHLALIRPHESVISGRFLFRCLQSDEVNRQFQMAANGVTRFGLPKAAVGNALIPVPIFQEQQKIAAFLDRKTAQIDRLIEIKRRQIEVLKEERTAVINHAVTKGLNPGVKMKESGIEWIGEIPEGWEVKRVKFLAEDGSGIQMGPFGSMLSKLPNGPTGYKLYGQENTISGNFSSGNRWLEPSRFSELEKYIMEEGDIVLTRKGSIGNCRLVPEGIMPGIIDSDTIRVRVNDNLISSRFFVLLLHDAWYLQSQILCNCRGAILSGLNTSTIAELFIMCPPREEQTEIEAFLRNELQKIDNLESTAKKTIQLLQEYRTTLISDAVTGKIDVREEAA